MKGSYW